MPQNILRNSTNLDFLRCVAVSFVVFAHTTKFLGYPFIHGLNVNGLGRLGVFFFFVHTCTVLMLSLERQSPGSPNPTEFIKFYVRRAFRIYPLSIFAIAVVVLFRIPSEEITGAFTLSNFTPTTAELIGNLTLIHNVWPHFSRNIIGVLWSLPYEVQMYLLLPAIFFWMARPGKLLGLFILWIASYFIASHVQMLSFVPDFLPGVMAYVIASRYHKRKLPSFLFPILLCIFTLLFYKAGTSFLAGRFICLALGMALPFFTNLQFPILNYGTKTIAKYSYGIYLSHIFCLWLAYNVIRYWHSVAYAMLLCCIPFVLYHGIEEPMIKLGQLLTGGTRSHKAVEDASKTTP
jgi:peptidoglycan/LPS O-acetylase OafA/YrhL